MECCSKSKPLSSNSVLVTSSVVFTNAVFGHAFLVFLSFANPESNIQRKTKNVKTSRLPKASRNQGRDIYERRAYAAQRAVIAVDRVSRVAAAGSPEEKERAHRWMPL